MKKYYTDINGVEWTTLAAKLKLSGIEGGPYMKCISITKPHIERVIKLHCFRTFTADAKKINDNGCV